MKKLITLITILIFSTTIAIVWGQKLKDNRGQNVPYLCDFSTQDDFDSWNLVNVNNDYNIWNRVKETWSDNYFASYSTNKEKDANDWIISVPIRLDAGRNYVLRYMTRTLTSEAKEKLKVTMGKGREVVNQTTILEDIETGYNTVFQERVISVKVNETGDYCFGFNCYSRKMNFGRIDIDDVIVEFDKENDLEALEVDVPIFPSQNKTYSCKILVRNKGRRAQSSYTVQLVDANDNILASKDIIDHSIAASKEGVLEIDWTPEEVGKLNVFGKVIAAGDNNPSNDKTLDYIEVDVKPKDAAEWSSVGDLSIGIDNRPFNFKVKTSVTQSIYLKNEIKSTSGMVEEILYFYHVFNNEIIDKRIKIYMSNANISSLADGWISKESLKLVYEGVISLDKSGSYVVIKLDKPFLYTGDNLCIMTERVMDNVAFPNFNGVFAATSDNSTRGRSRTFGSDIEAFDFSQDGTADDVLTNIMIAIQTKFGGIITGLIKGEDNSVIGGAIVELSSAENKISNGNGVYTFDYAPTGTYSLKAKSFGYEDKSIEVTVKNGETTTANINMAKRKMYKVTGRILDMGSMPIPDVLVKIDGYSAQQTTTNNDGKFEFERVHAADNYTLVATKVGFNKWNGTFTVVNSEIIIDDIKLQDILLPPSNVVAQSSDDVLTVSWGLPEEKTFRYDADNVKTGIGFITGTTKSVFGTAYREPAIINEMSWFTTDQGGPRESICLYVFSLNSNGQPTKNILFQKEDVAHTDSQWNTFVFPEPISAPNGFMLAIAYNGFAALAVDAGDSEEYPFLMNTHFFSRDYTTGAFTALEYGGAYGNCLIRAKGILNYGAPTKGSDESKSLVGYNVWRFLQGQEGQQSNWVKLTESATQKLQIEDTQWATLSDGNYCYAVNTVYSGGLKSGVSYSNHIAKNMITKLVVNAKTNTSTNEIEGAEVTLTNNDNNPKHVYKSVMNSMGRVEVDNIWKGSYMIKIELDGFKTIEQPFELAPLNSYTTPMYTLKEIQDEPFNLQVLTTDVDSKRVLRWNDVPNISESFERHEDFAINSSGEYGWSYIDGDRDYTSSITGIEFKNQTYPMAYIVFNPTSTEPPLPSYPSPPAPAHSGEKFLASITSLNSKTDDWIISPELKFYRDFQFKFFAKTYREIWALEKIQVGYSLTTKDPDQFIWLTDSPIEVPDVDWQEYSFDVPKDTKYVTIRNEATENYMLMIDDLFIGYERSRQFVRYKVYLDNNFITETTDIEYTFTNLTDGQHTAGVEAIYSSGASKMSVKTFYVGAVSPTTDVTVNVTTDKTDVDATGAIVTLSNVNGEPDNIYQAAVGSNGKASINQIMKGLYDVTVTLDNFEQISERNIDLSLDDTYQLAYTLKWLTGICSIEGSGIKITNPVNLNTNYKLIITADNIIECKIFGITGNLIEIHAFEVPNRGVNIDMQYFNAGIYILKIKTDSGKEFNHKIIRK